MYRNAIWNLNGPASIKLASRNKALSEGNKRNRPIKPLKGREPEMFFGDTSDGKNFRLCANFDETWQWFTPCVCLSF